MLELKNISLELDNKKILKTINLKIEKGDIACLLGPSGCGKTSLLRIIAGLEDRNSGSISLNGGIIQDEKQFLSPYKRKIGMVFQDYALFPHLTVKENILIGLDHLSKLDKEKKLQEMLNLVKLSDLKDSYPHKLSGGQQQRVALARALAPGPDILLLDEPFSNLDTELRYQLSADVRLILKELNMTGILVTHDQAEAFSFADKIGVMNNGVLEQFSSSFELYHRPQTYFVGNFIGEGVIVKGELVVPYITKGLTQTESLVLIRPEDIVYDFSSMTKARVMKKVFRGAHFLYQIEFPNGLQVLSLVESHHHHEIGEMIGIRLDMDQVVEFTQS